MGTCDFTTRPSRLTHFTYKWQTSESDPDLPQLWVADMDFLPVPKIKEATIDYGQEHIFGYNYFKDSPYQSVIDWERNEHSYNITKDGISFIDGVVPAISVAIRAFTERDDAMLTNSPVYYPFARTIRLSDRKLMESSLVIKNGHFEVDSNQLEENIVDNQVKLYVLYSLHNPGGRIWPVQELQETGVLYEKHGVILVPDGIHQDLALFGNKHHSFNTVDNRFKEFTLILSSATKTFNIAGTKNSFAIVQSPKFRKQFKRVQLTNNQHEVPTLGMITTETTFTCGKSWLEELKKVIEENINYVVDYFEENTKIKVMKPEGTCLVWLDFSAYGIEQPQLDEKLQKEAKVVLNDGAHFGKEGKNFARLDVAAPLETIKEASKRIASVFGK